MSKRIKVKKSVTVSEDEDGNLKIEIESKNQNKIIVDDSEEAITINDQHGNLISLSESGIVLKSTTDLTIESEGKIILAGKSGVKINSENGDIKEQATNIQHRADASFSALGSASASLDSSGTTQVKGSMVTIN